MNERITPEYYASLMRALSDRERVVEARTRGLRAAGLLETGD